MSNELMNISVKEEMQVVQGADGKFKRIATYKPFASIVAETKEQKIALLNLLNSNDEDGDEGAAKPFTEAVGTEISIADVIFNPYDSINEDTGFEEHGVVTYISDQEQNWYVTSSKSVYHSLKRLMQVFGEPHWSEEEAPIVKIVKKKGQQHQYVDLKLIG